MICQKSILCLIFLIEKKIRDGVSVSAIDNCVKLIIFSEDSKNEINNHTLKDQIIPDNQIIEFVKLILQPEIEIQDEKNLTDDLLPIERISDKEALQPLKKLRNYLISWDMDYSNTVSELYKIEAIFCLKNIKQTELTILFNS